MAGYNPLTTWPVAISVGPIHHWGDGEAAGEWGGCDGDRGHWGYGIGVAGRLGEFIRNEV